MAAQLSLSYTDFLCLQRGQVLCECSPDPRERPTSPHKTRLLLSWWREMVSARSLSPEDDARQLPLSQASLVFSLGRTLPAQGRPKPSFRRTSLGARCFPAGASGFVLVFHSTREDPQPIFGYAVYSRERVHCFLPRFVLLGASATHQLQNQRLTCLNLVFKMVYRECIASRDGLGSAANCLTSYYLVFLSQMLLKAWRGGLACGWSPGSASCGGCDFLHIRRPTGLSLHLGPLQGHFPVMERCHLHSTKM